MQDTVVRVRQNLSVEARFSEDGRIVPLRILVGDRVYTVDRLLHARKRAPDGVASVAPIEYSVIVDGILKRIYYEADSQSWFSVRVNFVEKRSGKGKRRAEG